jgi:catechol 2,3-dioxygenase-like lactoylglutathione lyase family enzyme
MELGASLARLELSSSDPQSLASFYASTFRLQACDLGHSVVCQAPGRELAFVNGPGGQLRRVSFRFAQYAGFDRQHHLLCRGPAALVEASEEILTVRDPHGHLVSFLPPSAGAVVAGTARLQHFALRTPDPTSLAQFYIEQLGFTVSDRVLDDAGDLTAIFLRTDAEHHSMALFRAPQVRFDHFSCEVGGWSELRDWADHMASVGVDLAWGIGRHGPGNDTFLMVRDVDGNLGEVSSDLEICAPSRPAGVWPHRPQTLNQWGVALMRS